jgi:hypothetical protein
VAAAQDWMSARTGLADEGAATLDKSSKKEGMKQTSTTIAHVSRRLREPAANRRETTDGRECCW